MMLMTPTSKRPAQLLSNCAQCLFICFCCCCCCCCRGATTQLGKLSFCRSTLLLLDQLSRRSRSWRRRLSLSVSHCECVNCAAKMPVAFFCVLNWNVVFVFVVIVVAASSSCGTFYFVYLFVIVNAFLQLLWLCGFAKIMAVEISCCCAATALRLIHWFILQTDTTKRN